MNPIHLTEWAWGLLLALAVAVGHGVMIVVLSTWSALTSPTAVGLFLLGLSLLLVARAAIEAVQRQTGAAVVRLDERRTQWAVCVRCETGSSFLVESKAVHAFGAVRSAERLIEARGLGPVVAAEVAEDVDGTVMDRWDHEEKGDWLDDEPERAEAA